MNPYGRILSAGNVMNRHQSGAIRKLYCEDIDMNEEKNYLNYEYIDSDFIRPVARLDNGFVNKESEPVILENRKGNYTSTGHVGFKDNLITSTLFSDTTVRDIAKKITELLHGAHPEKRPIIVPNETITNVLSAIYGNFRPATGDIYSRYIITSEENHISPFRKIIDQTIATIVGDVRNYYDSLNYNKGLTIWTTLLGDFNKHGLRSHEPIYTRQKRPDTMQFNMNY